jgi:hypothetical protein
MTDTYTWATVTNSPARTGNTELLRIRLDGESADLPITPETLIHPLLLEVGFRVWVHFKGNRAMIVASSPSNPFPYILTPRWVNTATDITIAANQTSYATTPDSPPRGAFFQVPPSGRVGVSITGRMRCWNATTAMTYSVREGQTVGSGTTVNGASDTFGIALDGQLTTNVALASLTSSIVVFSLTPGEWYNVAFLHLNSDTAQAFVIDNRAFNILPVG